MTVDYHIHCLAHGERKSFKENYLAFINEARKKGMTEIGFAEHNEYLDAVDYKLLQTLQMQIKDIKIKIGVEMEMPVTEDGFKMLSKYPLDYIIASVHIIDDWLFDHPDYTEKYAEYSADDLYRIYFEKIARLLAWSGYNIIGHLDLIKVFNKRSDFNFKPLIEKGLRGLRERNCAVEINTAGKYKPIGEIYPAPDVIEWLYQLDVPITLSSDAHKGEDTGRDIMKTLEELKKVGFKKIAGFTSLKRYLINID